MKTVYPISICLALAACGSPTSDSPPAAAAATALTQSLVCDHSTDGSCVELDERGNAINLFGGAESYSQQCVREDGTWSARGSCPRVNLLGTCTHPDGMTSYYYAGDDFDSLETVRGRCSSPSRWQTP